MATRHLGLISAALVLSAMATGCSESGKVPEKKAQESKPIHTVRTTAADDEGSVAVTKPTNTDRVSFADGEAAYNARNYTEATGIFARYTEQRPNNAWGHFMLGLSAWKGGDRARSEEAFDAALRIDPDHFKSLVNSSRVLLEQKRPDEAVERLTRAAELDPTSSNVQRLLGRAYHAQGKIDDAVVAYRQAIEINEKDSWAMNNLGLLFFAQGRAGDAVPLLARAVELEKNVAEFHNNLGMALEHTGRFADAAKAYSGALAADPAYAKAKQNLARVEQVKEDPKAPIDAEAATKRSGR